MAPRPLRATTACVLTLALAPAAAHAAAPSQFVTTQGLVRVAAGAPTGFFARAIDATGLTAARTLRVEVVDAAVLGPQPGAVQIRRPGPSPAAAARVTLGAGPLRLGPDATVSVALACSPGADCAGRVALGHGGRRLATAAYAVAAGRRATVRLRLPAALAARLRRRPERGVVVTVAPDGQTPVRAARVLRTA